MLNEVWKGTEATTTLFLQYITQAKLGDNVVNFMAYAYLGNYLILTGLRYWY